MAEIEVYGIGSTSFSVKLTGLQTKDITYTRKCAWTVYEVSSYNSVASSVTYISPGYEEGGDFTFSGMSPNTEYLVNCYITRTDTGAYLTSLSCDTFYTESGGDVSNWVLFELDSANISQEDYREEKYLYEKAAYVLPVVFSESGYTHFYTYDYSGYVDTCVYLSRSPDFDYANGEPTNYVSSNSGGLDGHNSDIKYYVTAGVTYYFFVRGYSETVTGYVDVYVDVPWGLNTLSYGTLSAEKTETVSIMPYTLYRRSMYFETSGTVTFSSSGYYNLAGFLGITPGWDWGVPDDYIASNTDSLNFSITYDVTAGQIYYLWFRGHEAGTASISVSDVSGGSSIAKWNWFASNGSASKDVTTASYYALSKGTPTTSFSHLVWNDMVDKAYEIIRAKTNWWDENYASYNNTKMNSPPYELTAKMFNSLRNNIELIGNRSDVLGYKTGIGQVFAKNTDYPVKAEYFITLANYINDCIDNL